MKNKLKITLSIVTVAALAISTFPSSQAYSSPSQTSVMSKNDSTIFDINTSNLNVRVELLEGTKENWSKLKVTNDTDGTVEYLTRVMESSIETINIETTYTNVTGLTTNESAIFDKHKVEVKDGTVLLDGKNMIDSTEATSSHSLAQSNSISPTAGATWYFVQRIDGSVNTDVATVGICISVLSAALGSTALGVSGIAGDIFALKIPYTWYSKWKYSDKAVYQPKYLINIYTYSDSLRTRQTGYTEYIL